MDGRLAFRRPGWGLVVDRRQCQGGAGGGVDGGRGRHPSSVVHTVLEQSACQERPCVGCGSVNVLLQAVMEAATTERRKGRELRQRGIISLPEDGGPAA